MKIRTIVIVICLYLLLSGASLGYISGYFDFMMGEIAYSWQQYQKSAQIFSGMLDSFQSWSLLQDRAHLWKTAAEMKNLDYSGAITSLESFESEDSNLESERQSRLWESWYHLSESATGSEKALDLEAALKSYQRSESLGKNAKTEWNIHFIESLLKKDPDNAPDSQTSDQKDTSSDESKENSSSSWSSSKTENSASGSGNKESSWTSSGKTSGVPISKGEDFSSGIGSGSQDTDQKLSNEDRAVIEEEKRMIENDQNSRNSYIRPDGKKDSVSSGIPNEMQGFLQNDPMFQKFFGENDDEKRDW